MDRNIFCFINAQQRNFEFTKFYFIFVKFTVCLKFYLHLYKFFIKFGLTV